jgi:hypothetical protein
MAVVLRRRGKQRVVKAMAHMTRLAVPKEPFCKDSDLGVERDLFRASRRLVLVYNLV